MNQPLSLSKISIQGYKSINNSGFLELRSLNILVGALTVSLELIQTCVYDVKHEQANNNTRSSSISRSFSSNIAPLGT